MKQVTLRLPDELATSLRDEAARADKSLNAWVTTTLKAALDPDNEDDEMERIRGRLRRAGVLAEPEPVDVEPPSDAEFEEARRAAGRSGPLLSDLISEGRGPR